MSTDDIEHIHFIGIGGIGMSALARFFKHEGKIVSGSDKDTTPITCGLEALGIEVRHEQTAANITDDIDLIVYTEAMSGEQEEMVAARKLGVPMMNYFDALGVVANPYELITVAGSHGKTTTTAMLIDVFEKAGLDPTGIVGSLRASTKSNFRPGKSKWAIVEACEYRRDFLSLTPDILVITNLEYEHVDYYESVEDVQAAFRELIGQVREGGRVVTNPKDPFIVPIIEAAPVRVVDYTKFLDPTLRLKQPGLHNAMNAAAALAVATEAGIDKADAKGALEEFAGTWRRFEYKGSCNGAMVIDDYAHHPTEIATTIEGVREGYPSKKVTAVFQPHTYSRLHAFLPEFAEALAQADRIVLAPIYAAREDNVTGITIDDLRREVEKLNPAVVACDSLEDIVSQVREFTTKEHVVLVMGAGTITKVAEELTKLV